MSGRRPAGGCGARRGRSAGLALLFAPGATTLPTMDRGKPTSLLFLIVIAATAPLRPGSAQDTWSAAGTGALTVPLYDLAFGDGQFVAVGAEGTFATSPDGQSWTAGTFGVTSEDIAGVGFGAGEFLAVGQDGTVLRSADAATWAAEDSTTNGFLSSCAFGCGRWVAVGAAGVVATAAAPDAWTTVLTPDATFLAAVAFGSGHFVAVGQNGTVARSADGLTWTSGASGTSAYLTGLAYVDGTFLAAGQDGVLLRSDDAGATWSALASGTTSWLNGIAAGGGRAAAAGFDGTVVVSSGPGFAAWTPAASNSTDLLNAVAHGGGRFAAVGEDPAGAELPRAISSAGPGLPEFAWSVTELDLTESAGAVMLEVTRGDSAGAAAIAVDAFDVGTEGAGDYSLSGASVEFADGQSSATLTLTTVADATLEGFEYVSLELRSPPAGSALGAASKLCVRIRDDEDLDGDLLPDAWEIQYFGDVTSEDAEGDPDDDGNNNLREYEDGTDPTLQSSARYRIAAAVVGDGSVAVSPDQPAGYDRGTAVTLTATPGAESEFLQWVGNHGAAAATNPLTLNLTFDVQIAAHFGGSLREALDTDEFTLATFGAGEWFGQPTVSFDGEDSARSPALGGRGNATMQTFAEGPGQLTFRWRCSCADGIDFARFESNGTIAAIITGESDWAEVSVALSPGVNRLRWTYARNSAAPVGADAAWVDTLAMTYSYGDWRAAEFSAADAADDAVSGPGADPDADGTSNLLEYLLGYPPLQPEARGGLTTSLVNVSGELHHQFFFRVRKGRRAGLDIGLAESPDLAAWAPTGLATEPFLDDLRSITFSVIETVPVGGRGAGFHYRLEVKPVAEP